ncbi:porin [Paraburkholderia sp.]|uniref:porin n=1 Tax=Paraburkholderia sp. TaxID=1926495 RepID=UPI002D3E4020|nr:porin [Paraburkholderia sp.]HZZ02745.1 porin [Paraburkholderia sp.]
MKVKYLAGAMVIFGSTGAVAQSSVTLYGLTDISVQYLTHVNRAGDSVIRAGTGGLSESRFGMYGSEDLGGGNAAIFHLENRFNLNNGQSDPALPFWNTAFVGLRSASLGSLTMGRQTNVLIDTVTRTYASNPWVPYDFAFQPEITMLGGIWSSNMAKYAIKLGDVIGEASYAFGGVAGNTSYGSQLAVGVAYVPAAPVRLGAGYMDSRDTANGAHSKSWTAGASYTWQSTQFHVGYFEDRLDAGFQQYLNGPFTAAALTALKFTDFSSRRMFSAGVVHSFSWPLRLSFNYWRTLQTGKTARLDGNASQFELVADYNLSKRTDVYLEGNYALYRGDLIGAQIQGVNGVGTSAKGTQLGLMAGLRHQF